jgi:hypothetical protein
MPLGCLSGNGRAAAIEGGYSYQRRGLKEELFPDLVEEKAGKSGWIPFSEGSLTDGDGSTVVGWRGDSLGEIGVDVSVDLKKPYFIDRVVLVQGQNALNSVEVYARSRVGSGYRLVGQVKTSFPGKPITEERISISLGLEASDLIIRLDSFNRDAILKELEVWGSSLDEPRLFPIPQKMELDPHGGVFKLTEMKEIIVGQEASEDTLFAAKLLAEKFFEDFGVEVPVVKEPKAKRFEGIIALGKPGECRLLDKESGLKADKPEGYALRISQGKAFLTALDRRGLIYVVEALLQLFLSGDGLAVEGCVIEDYPRMAIRGVHFGIPPREEIPFIKRLIRYLLAPMRMNTIFLQVTAGMKFDRRPEINEAWERANRKATMGKAPPVPHGDMVCGGSYLTKEEVRDLVEYAREYGFEVIPEVQSLSHVQYLTITYPEIAEEKGEASVTPPYPHCYCPLHPDVYKIVFDMIDEVVEVFKPVCYVHMGHDEAYMMAVCERCKGKSKAELYAGDVNKIYQYLKSKGLGMMIWADMLQPFRYYSSADAIDMIPKDIIMLDFVWYFRLDEDIEDHLLQHGFKVIMGNFYSSHYTRYTTRSAKAGMLGAEVSTWCRTDEYTLAALGKLYDFIYSANMIWTSHYSNELRWTMDRMIARLIPRIRSKLGGRLYPSQAKEKEFVPIDLSGSYTSSLVDENGGKGGFDFSTLPKGEPVLGGVPFKLGDGLVIVEGDSIKDKHYPSEVKVPVDKRLNSVVFLHACSKNSVRRAFAAPGVIGCYTIEYEDGSTVDIKAKYGYNIAEWNRRYADPLIHPIHRHAGYITTYTVDPLWQGKTATGQDVTAYSYEWVNQHSEKIIRTIKVSAHEGATDSALILIAATGVS